MAHAKKMEQNINDLIDIVVEIKENMATKEDLKNFLTKEDAKNFATKQDIEQLRLDMNSEFATTNANIQALEKRTLDDTNATALQTVKLKKRVGALERTVTQLQAS